MQLFRIIKILSCVAAMMWWGACKPISSSRSGRAPTEREIGVQSPDARGTEDLTGKQGNKEAQMLKVAIAMDYAGRSCTLKKDQIFLFHRYVDEHPKYIEFSVTNPPEGCELGNFFFLPADSVNLLIDHPYTRLTEKERQALEEERFPSVKEVYEVPVALGRKEQVPDDTDAAGDDNDDDAVANTDTKTRTKRERNDGVLYFPTKPCPIAPYAGSRAHGRQFGALRVARKHAAVDLLADPEVRTGVYAVADGEVLDHYYFYSGSYATVVDHDDFLVRYGEVKRDDDYLKIHSLPAYKRMLKAGELFGRVAVLYSGSAMLHFELYAGTHSGPLTVSKRYPYQRRADLLNPTNFVRSLESHYCP